MDNGLLNKGGTILFDNAMFYGQAYAEDCTQGKMPNGWGVRKCNEFIAADTRVERVRCHLLLFLVMNRQILLS